jgi:hypothetical protein
MEQASRNRPPKNRESSINQSFFVPAGWSGKALVASGSNQPAFELAAVEGSDPSVAIIFTLDTGCGGTESDAVKLSTVGSYSIVQKSFQTRIGRPFHNQQAMNDECCTERLAGNRKACAE